MLGYALRFILGGVLVLLSTLLADITKDAPLSGMFAAFPALVIASAVVLSQAGYDATFISRFFIGTLFGIVACIAFVVATSFLVKHMTFWPSVGLGLCCWAVVIALIYWIRL